MQHSTTFSIWSWMRHTLVHFLYGLTSFKYSKSGQEKPEPTLTTPATQHTTVELTRNEDTFKDVPSSTAPLIIEVTNDERQKIMLIGKTLLKEYIKFSDPVFISMLFIIAHKHMPERIVKILSDFASDFGYDQFGAIVFRGLVEVDQNDIGPTPPTWRETDFKKIQVYGFISALMHACVRAIPIELYYQRKGGGTMHSVIPNNSMAETQTGEGSATVLFVHTEDPCLNSKADFLSFLFLRNEEAVPSTLYSLRTLDLCKPYVETLMRPIFKFPLDGNYTGSDKSGGLTTASILSGNRTLPFMRFDPVEQLPPEANQIPEAQYALEQFWKDAQSSIYQDFIPCSGDMVFVNNRIVAHGRSLFMAGYKKVGNELIPCEKRWMLRMMSTANLMDFYEYAHPENPYLSMEKHFGELFTNENTL